MRPILVLLLSLVLIQFSYGQDELMTWEELDKRPIPEWFEDAKFGIFIHWGVYSVPAYRALSEKKYASYAEWYYARVMFDTLNGGADFHARNYGEDFDYHDFGPMFKAELFDPDHWAQLFKQSGARYVVLTSKHHDGYCLWPATNPRKEQWNAMNVGPKRDLVGELTEAVRQEGLKMGLYYSLIEWESSPTTRRPNGWWLPDEVHTKYRIPEEEYVGLVNQELREIVDQYQPSLIFSDGGEWDGNEDYWGTRQFLSWLYQKSPVKDEVVVNDRFCKGMPGKHGDYFSSEYQDADGVGLNHPWEESRGIGGSYGYNRAENLSDYRTSTELIHELIDIVSRGGNLLLNVGPTADGRIPVIMQQRLHDIGAWLQVNGPAIYGTVAYRTGKSALESIRFTKKGDDIYALCLDWPGKFLVLDGLPNQTLNEVSLLGSDIELVFSQNKSRLLIQTPVLDPKTTPCAHAWVFKLSFGD